MSKVNFPFNVILPIFIVFASIGLYWLDRLGLDAGSAYLWLVVLGLFFLIIVFVAKASGVDFWVEIPINRTSERGVLMFFTGLGSLFALYVIPLIAGLTFYSPAVMAPLASFSLGAGTASFSALQTATSPFWTFFITVISAPIIEELVLGWAFVAIGALVMGKGLRKLLNLDFNNNDTWDFIMAMIFSVVIFSLLHMFNGTYLNADGTLNAGLFIFAGTFRLVLNMLIYKFGNFGLLFSIGVHAMNNAIFVGRDIITEALLAFPGGIILDVILLLLFIFMILRVKFVVQEVGLVSKDFVTFE